MAAKYVTTNDDLKLGELIEHYLPQFVHMPDKPLHHYTTAENLISILSHSELWSTHIACLNDTKELLYAVDELHKRVKARLSTNKNPDLLPLLTKLDGDLQEPSIETAPFFVACFSELKDDLSQWRAYGGGENGYHITFDPETIRKSAFDASVMLVKVDYNPKHHEIIFDDALKWAENFFLSLEGRKLAPTPEDWATDFVEHFLQRMSFFAACLKNEAFSAEQEWRLLLILGDDGQAKNMKFRTKPFTISRHIPLPIAKPLPIVGVTVGPCRYPALSKIAVGDLLVVGNLDPNSVNIEKSSVPYRG